MTAIYDHQGVRFAYPENWKIEHGEDEEATLQVTVASPHTAFWSLSIYPGLRNTRALLDEVLQAMQAEYPDLESNSADEIIDGLQIVGFDLDFICLDLTNTARARVFHRDQNTCLLLCQAEDREFEQIEQVFRAMTLSLLQKAEK